MPPTKGKKKAQKRERRVLSFSFRPDDGAMLEYLRQRVGKFVPDANVSEVIRIAMFVLDASTDGAIKDASMRLERVESGRPRSSPHPQNVAGDSLVEYLLNERDFRKKHLLLDELTRLEKGPRGDAHVEARIERLYFRLGMTPAKP